MADAGSTYVPPTITSQQVASLLTLVRAMGVLVHDVSEQNVQLRSEMTTLTNTTQTKIGDLGQRIGTTREENAKLRADLAALAGSLQAKAGSLEQRVGVIAHDAHDVRDQNTQLRNQVATLATATQTKGPDLERRFGTVAHEAHEETAQLRTQIAALTSALQANTSELDRRLGSTAHDAHEEAAQLRKQVAALADALQTTTTAVEQRGKVAETTNVTNPAPRPDKDDAAAGPPVSGNKGTVRASAVPSPPQRLLSSYRVIAASDGIALLGDVNGASGQVSGRLYNVGEQLPGAGRISSITQRGTTWVVQTERGMITQTARGLGQ